MPFREQPNYSHLIIVVRHCSSKIIKLLFLKSVEAVTPFGHKPNPWTVDHFLERHKDVILKNRRARDFEGKLFPTPTDLDCWDITIYCFLLSKFCNLGVNVLNDVEELRDIRNELVHFGEGDLDDQKYQTFLGKLDKVVDSFSAILNIPELREELKAFLNKRYVPKKAEIELAKKEMKEWFLNEKRFQILQEGLYELLTKLQNIQEKFEKSGKSTEIPFTFVILIKCEGQNKDADKALSDAHYAISSGAVLTRKAIEQKVRTVLERIKEDVRKTGSDVENETSESIMFKFTCFSLTSLIFLVDYFNGPIVERRLHGINEAVEDEIGDIVTLRLCIPDYNLQEITAKLEAECMSEDTVGTQAKRIKLSRKVFHDSLYGQIELHPLCSKIIDTPQFQRLRHIKQLETLYLIYPGASHTRFEHAIGVCHLAGKLLRVLKERQPELDITTKDILCVEIAALCNDLGQAPFPHVFERRFIPAVTQDFQWKHATASVKMFDYMLQDKNGKLFEDFRNMMPGFEERDIVFIKELIAITKDLDAEVWPCVGRNKNKSFLYEVVDNPVNGIDVDLWDYIARDSYMLGLKTVFDHNRLIHHARVLFADGRRQICYKDKAAQDLYDMFYARMTLHRKAYQHKKHNIIGMMILDALRDANDHVSFEGENGIRRKISDTIHDMKAFTQLTDDILQKIQRSSKKALTKARATLERIVHRDFYKCITETKVDVRQKGWVEKTTVQENLFNKIKQKRADITDVSEILEIDVVNLDYGSKEADPVTKVWFYKTGQEEKAIRINREQVSFVLPDTFAEQYVRVYSSAKDPELFEIIEQSFTEWCVENDIPTPKVHLKDSID